MNKNIKTVLKSTINGIFVGVGILITIILGGFAYAAISSVNSGDTLSSTLWNNLTTQVNKNTINSINRTIFNFSSTSPYGITAGNILPLYPSNAAIGTNGNNIVLKAGNLYLIDMSIRVDGADGQYDERATISVYNASNDEKLESYLDNVNNGRRGQSTGSSFLLRFDVDTEIYVKVDSESSNPCELQNSPTYISVSEIDLGN